MNTSEILNKAADLIEERGWTSGDWGERASNAPLCLEGAIVAAMGRSGPGLQAHRDAMKSCGLYAVVWNYLQSDTRWGQHRGAIYDWNDAPNRTAAEVIEVLRATAVIEAARESEHAGVSA